MAASDEELLSRLITSRDVSACAELFERHWSWSVGAARRLGVDDGSEEDLVHELWLAIWASPPILHDGDLRAWLWGALRNRAATHKRKHAQIDRLDSSFEGGCATPIQVFAPIELPRVTRRAHERGELDSSDVLAAALVSAGATSKEVGSWLERSPSAVRDWWQRSFRKMRALDR